MKKYSILVSIVLYSLTCTLEAKGITSYFFDAHSSESIKFMIQSMYKQATPHTPVHVHENPHIRSKEEERFYAYRTQKVRKALKDIGIDESVTLSICCSGGGIRAMIGTLGLLSGLHAVGLLDATYYLSALSGSTWAIIPYCYLAAKHKAKNAHDIINELKQNCINSLSHFHMLSMNGIYLPPLLSFESTDDFCIDIAKRVAFEQPLSLVNLFGALVGDLVLKPLGQDRLSINWSSLIAETQKGMIPMPLCASVYETEPHHYNWFEMSPLQSGCPEYGYIPTRYMGSQYVDGVLKNDTITPEYPLSFYLGVYGSAFSATIQDMIHVQKKMRNKVTILQDHEFRSKYVWIQSFSKQTIQTLMSSRHAATYATFHHYASHKTGLFGLLDAGISCDYPLPLITDRSFRASDVIILYGSFPGSVASLDKLAKYCYAHKHPFPDPSLYSDEELREQNVTFLNHPHALEYDITMPTYIYVPTNGIDISTAPYHTFNFKYSAEETNYLFDNIEQSILKHKAEIIETIQLVARTKQKGIS